MRWLLIAATLGACGEEPLDTGPAPAPLSRQPGVVIEQDLTALQEGAQPIKSRFASGTIVIDNERYRASAEELLQLEWELPAQLKQAIKSKALPEAAKDVSNDLFAYHVRYRTSGTRKEPRIYVELFCDTHKHLARTQYKPIPIGGGNCFLQASYNPRLGVFHAWRISKDEPVARSYSMTRKTRGFANT